MIYRIAQEAITNALRHAHADIRRRVSLRVADDAVQLRIARRRQRHAAQSVPLDTAGLAGMRERAMLIGGRPDISSRPRAGTEVRLDVPLNEAAVR